jgi:hypothetical protein
VTGQTDGVRAAVVVKRASMTAKSNNFYGGGGGNRWFLGCCGGYHLPSDTCHQNRRTIPGQIEEGSIDLFRLELLW